MRKDKQYIYEENMDGWTVSGVMTDEDGKDEDWVADVSTETVAEKLVKILTYPNMTEQLHIAVCLPGDNEPFTGESRLDFETARADAVMFCQNNKSPQVLILTVENGQCDVVQLTDLEIKQAQEIDTPYISAKCHSDDRVFEISFNALPWLAIAKVNEILELNNCEWANDYPADNVGYFMAPYNHEIAEMLRHAERMSKIKPCGFECSVDPTEAMAYLEQYRPDVHAAIVEANKDR